MKKISFIITNFNTKKYTKWCYDSIRKNLDKRHEIVLLDDGSEDGTWDLLKDIKNEDRDVQIYRNEENIGIAYSYNKMVELSTNEIVCMLHPDMYVPPKFDEIMLKYMKEYDFITPLRVEPNVGYPESVDKFLIDFGTRSEEFEEDQFIGWHEKNIKENENRTEQRMFFPWMTTKTLYNKVGGNDQLFLKYMVDDDDFYLRIKMAGAKYTQLFETAVYHMPSKSVRMREDKDIKVDVDSQYRKSIRNFIRKWGTSPGQVWDDNRDMVIPQKYDIGFIMNNHDEKSLFFLEPWCTNIYIYNRMDILNYCNIEQSNTIYCELSKKIRHIDETPGNDILVNFDVKKLNEERVGFLQRLPEIIELSGQIGKMKYDIFELEIKSMNTYEHELMKNKRSISYE